jgi:hypothetical protein
MAIFIYIMHSRFKKKFILYKVYNMNQWFNFDLGIYNLFTSKRNYKSIINSLNKDEYTLSEYSEISQICSNKINDIKENLLKKKFIKLNESSFNSNELENVILFIKSMDDISIDVKYYENTIAFSIEFEYNNHTIEFRYKISDKDNTIVSFDKKIFLINNNTEVCYNLFGDNIYNDFIKYTMINFDIKKFLNNIFKIFKTNKPLVW